MKTICMIGLMMMAAAAASADEVDLVGRRSRGLEMQSFRLDHRTELVLDAVGIRRKFSDELFASAWILDERGRTVWSLDEAEWSPLDDERYLVGVRDGVALEPGAYMAFLYPGGEWRKVSAPFRDIGRLFNDIADMLRNDDPGHDPDAFAARCSFVISAADGGLRLLDESPMPEARIVLAPVGDSEVRETLVRVERPTRLKISACGERDRDGGGLWDLGWIEDAVTGEPVWTMSLARCTSAGGAEKNVHWRGEVPVEPGTYRVSYATDSSHAWGSWNVRPPDDPRLWGMLVDVEDEGALAVLDGDVELPERDVLVRWLRVGDDEDLSRDVAFERPVRVKIHAVGEGGRRSMYDGGSITSLDTGRVAWEMAWSNTSHAGGDDKNRLYHGTIELPAGRYRIAFSTDGSHAFGVWNAAPPREPFRYGLIVRVVD
jgi:hypothetical protein